MLLANRVNPVRISASISPRHQSRPPGSMASPYGTVTLSPRSSWAPGPRPVLPVPAPSPGLYLPAARVLLPGGPGSTARRPGFYRPGARTLEAGRTGLAPGHLSLDQRQWNMFQATKYHQFQYDSTQWNDNDTNSIPWHWITATGLKWLLSSLLVRMEIGVLKDVKTRGG